MSHLIVASCVDKIRRDASAVFVPCSRKYLELHPGSSRYLVDCTGNPALRRKRFFEAVASVDKADVFVFFGHGFPTGIQPCLGMGHIDRLSSELKRLGTHTVVLYACSTGNGMGKSFAYNLGNRSGCRVIAHTNKGHAVRNPYVIEFSSESASLIVDPTEPMWKRWVGRLRATDLAYRFPDMSRDELRKAVSG